MTKKGIEKLNLTSSVIFFFDMFLAFLIISSSSFLITNEIGKFSLLFGIFMLVLTVALRISKQW